MEYELLKAPHRTFLNNDDGIDAHPGGAAPRGGRGQRQRQQLIVYNLPSSLAEYLSTPCQEEAAYVRSLLYRGGGGGGGDGGRDGDNSYPRLVAYDPNADSFLGAEEADCGGTGGDDDDDLPPASRVLLLDGGNDAASRGATLVALSDLERSAASRLYGDPAGDAASRRRSPSGGGDVVVLVGSGGREHALAAALAASPLVGEVHCLPGNGGTMAEMMGGKIRNAEGIIASTMVDNATVIEYVRGVNADMVVIGPEQPLVDGLVDALRAECPDVMAFGPTSAGARLEASKVRR